MPTLSLEPLKGYTQTVEKIKRNILHYWTDMLLFPELLLMNPEQYFLFIQKIPYVSDPKETEFVTRPKILLETVLHGVKHFFDCDDRAGLSGAYFEARNRIYGENNKIEIVVCGQPEAVKPMLFAGKVKLVNVPHHVYIEYSGIPFDPTYPENRFQKRLFPEAYRKTFLVRQQ